MTAALSIPKWQGYLLPTKAKALKESDERHEYQDVKQGGAAAARRALAAGRAEAAAGARAVRALEAGALRCVPRRPAGRDACLEEPGRHLVEVWDSLASRVHSWQHQICCQTFSDENGKDPFNTRLPSLRLWSYRTSLVSASSSQSIIAR